jgi:hypothetical protein
VGEVDLVVPVYLKGRRLRYDSWVCKDAYDGAVCLLLAESRKLDEVLWLLGEGWKERVGPSKFSSTMPVCWLPVVVGVV